jgi:hypothetical protein
MVNHLRANFPAMSQLYTSFSTRKTPPTVFEIEIAAASKEVSEEDINQHLKSLDIAQKSTIQEAFEKQMTVCDIPF